MSDTSAIILPDDLRPQDGRFGSGPSKVRPEQVDALLAAMRAWSADAAAHPAKQ